MSVAGLLRGAGEEAEGVSPAAAATALALASVGATGERLVVGLAGLAVLVALPVALPVTLPVVLLASPPGALAARPSAGVAGSMR